MKLIILLPILLLATSVLAAKTNSCRTDTARTANHQNTDHIKSITISTLFTHFSPTSNNNGLEYDTDLISPGLEIKYCYALNNSVILSTGLNYQYNKLTYRFDDPSIKTITNELTIPFVISLNVFQNWITGLQLSSGCYLGQYLSITEYKREPRKFQKNYSEFLSGDDIIADLYFDIGKNRINKNIPIEIDLFLRYRLKEHSLVNFYVSRIFYGLKLSYDFNF